MAREKHYRQRFRLLVTGDLHYGLHGKSVESVARLAHAVNRSRADAFVIAGDFACGGLEKQEECLSLFSGFRGAKLLIPGNHELWTLDGDSSDIYENSLPALAEQAGFHMLDGHPARFGNVAIVGNIGWYDYSFRDKSLNVDSSCYLRKSIPRLVTLNDGRFVRWRYSDKEFTQHCCRKLRRDILKVNKEAEIVIVIMHFLPFEQLIPQTKKFPYTFLRAFMGSPCLGQVLSEFRKVKHVFCGHIHLAVEARCGGIQGHVLAGGRRRSMLKQLWLPEQRVSTRVFNAQ